LCPWHHAWNSCSARTAKLRRAATTTPSWTRSRRTVTWKPSRSDFAGRDAARAAYVGYFAAFPDLKPDDQAVAFGDDAMVA
jgi:hypothetical protein